MCFFEKSEFSCLEIIGYNQEPLKIKKQNLQKIQAAGQYFANFSSRSAKLLQSNIDLTGFNVLQSAKLLHKYLQGSNWGLVISKKPDLTVCKKLLLLF